MVSFHARRDANNGSRPKSLWNCIAHLDEWWPTSNCSSDGKQDGLCELFRYSLLSVYLDPSPQVCRRLLCVLSATNAWLSDGILCRWTALSIFEFRLFFDLLTWTQRAQRTTWYSGDKHFALQFAYSGSQEGQVKRYLRRLSFARHDSLWKKGRAKKSNRCSGHELQRLKKLKPERRDHQKVLAQLRVLEYSIFLYVFAIDFFDGLFKETKHRVLQERLAHRQAVKV